MVTEKPARWPDGQRRQHGSLADDARRRLTDAEIRWNNEMMEKEGSEDDIVLVLLLL